MTERETVNRLIEVVSGMPIMEAMRCLAAAMAGLTFTDGLSERVSAQFETAMFVTLSSMLDDARTMRSADATKARMS